MFSIQDKGAKLGTKNCPELVTTWIKTARPFSTTWKLDTVDVYALADDWCLWWDGLAVKAVPGINGTLSAII